MGERPEVQPAWLQPRRLAVDLLLAFYALFVVVNYLGSLQGPR